MNITIGTQISVSDSLEFVEVSAVKGVPWHL
jgi:hypothetical protein